MHIFSGKNVLPPKLTELLRLWGLFSAVAQVLTSRRRRTTDDTLDRLLFLRSVRK